jgi:hypothetical protein
VSRLPLAIRFATIEHSDLDFAREVVSQAVSNLAPHATITSLAIDRGFTDGPFLWWLAKTMEIIFYIPAKTNMNVYKDALSLLDTGIAQTRERKRTIGAGKNKTTVTDRWHVVGIEGLTSAGFYGEKGSGSHENRADFTPNPIHAVVVVDDPYKAHNPHTDTLVILTNAPVHKPLKVYDGYDARSEIENTVFREAKQAWFIQRAPRNTASAFRAHVYLTIITMALTTAFQTWMDQQDRLEQAGNETGIRKFRQKVKQENGNKQILFDEDRYAIFDTYRGHYPLRPNRTHAHGRAGNHRQKRYPPKIRRSPGVASSIRRSHPSLLPLTSSGSIIGISVFPPVPTLLMSTHPSSADSLTQRRPIAHKSFLIPKASEGLYEPSPHLSPIGAFPMSNIQGIAVQSPSLFLIDKPSPSSLEFIVQNSLSQHASRARIPY